MRPHALLSMLLFSGCAPQSPAIAPGEIAPPVGSAPQGVSSQAPPASLAGGTDAPRASEGAANDRDCPLAWQPRRLGASVVSLPAEVTTLAMAPVLRALCACTKPGSRTSVVVEIEPSLGRVTAHSDERALDRCLSPRLGDGLYPTFEIGGDCIDCGPKRYGVFGGPPPEPPRGVRIRMPFDVDRSSER